MFRAPIREDRVKECQPVAVAAANATVTAPATGLKKILFVDDEQRVLEGLKRMLYSMRQKWDMVFAASGKQALEMLAAGDFDLVVTDIHMPGMSGIELLTEVVQRHPQVIRFVLSGATQQDTTLRSVALAHQYLVKPCEAQVLRGTIERALSFRMLLDKPSLKGLVSGVGSLPSVPSTYVKLLNALANPDIELSDIGKIIASDLAMTAKILQLVNSAFFGFRRHIGNPKDAVMYLGVETVKALALTVSAFSQFETNGALSAEELRNHSLRVGGLAKQVASGMKLSPSDIDDCFTGGLLHDIGKLVLCAKYPAQYQQVLQLVRQKELSASIAEREIFGVSHSEVGAYLLWLWGLPDPVIGAVVHHHAPAETPEAISCPATVVGFANALIRQAPSDDFDIDAYRRAGFVEDLDHWRRIANEILTSEIAHV